MITYGTCNKLNALFLLVSQFIKQTPNIGKFKDNVGNMNKYMLLIIRNTWEGAVYPFFPLKDYTSDTFLCTYVVSR